MIEQNAVVLKLKGQMATVEAIRQSSCGQCNARKGCGTGALESALSKRSMQMQARNQCQAEPGDEVVVAVPEKGFVKSAFITYLLPLVFMLAGALFAQYFIQAGTDANNDIAALLGAGLGFMLALLVLKAYSKHVEKDEQLIPVIIRKMVPPNKIILSPELELKEQKHF